MVLLSFCMDYTHLPLNIHSSLKLWGTVGLYTNALVLSVSAEQNAKLALWHHIHFITPFGLCQGLQI